MDLPKRIDYVGSITEHFWKRWRFDYATSLREYQKRFKPKNQLFPAKNIRLSYKDKQSRQKWLLGKTLELIPIPKRQVPWARILLGKSRNTVDTPINRLYPLETNSKFVLKDRNQSNIQEEKEQGTYGLKLEAAELTEVHICYASGINWRGGSVN